MLWKIALGYASLLAFLGGAAALAKDVAKLRSWGGVVYESDRLAEMRVRLRRWCRYEAVAVAAGVAGMAATVWLVLR